MSETQKQYDTEAVQTLADEVRVTIGAVEVTARFVDSFADPENAGGNEAEFLSRSLTERAGALLSAVTTLERGRG